MMKTIQIKPSKSYSQRAILYALFSGIKTQLHNIYPLSNDSKSALWTALDFGAVCHVINKSIISIDSSNLTVPESIDVSESGTLCRMIIPVLSYFDKIVTINGSGSLLNRSLRMNDPMYNIFKLLYGVDIKMSEDFKLPVIVDAREKKGGMSLQKYYSFTGKDTSQYISGFLILFSLLNYDNLIVDIKDCYSLDYVLLTVDTLQTFGVKIKIEERGNTSCRLIFHSSRKPEFVSYNIEGDWSGAAGVIIYHLLFNPTQKIKYDNLYYNSIQIDKRVLELLKNFANIEYDNHSLTINRNSSIITPFEFDCTFCPDLFPVVCALASTITSGWSKISGLSRLGNKESNRGKVIFEEFKKYGISTRIEDDSIYILGTTEEVEDPGYDSYNDHRIAMALIILRTWYGLSVPSNDPCLNKSYSTFIQDTVYEK